MRKSWGVSHVAHPGIIGLALLFSLAASPLLADDGTNLEQQISDLRQQNAALQQQLQQQSSLLDSLTQKVQDLESASGAHENAVLENSAAKPGGFSLGKVDLSGEGGVAFFNTGREGFAPQSDFRVDEARLFVTAPIWDEVYFYSEVDLATRENVNLNVQLNELYLDAQDISRLWGQDNQFNIRAGRMEIPFGEEYLTRYAIDDPLISHSVSDIWGVAPGIEAYGSLGKFSYVLAVQNGSGANGVQDFDGDKSVAGRIGYDPVHWLHLSVSGMRTGNLNVQQDMNSALWISEGFFRSLGSPATTRFQADLVEADLTARWRSGHVSAFGGYALYIDNDPASDNGRNIFYYSVEGVQDLPKRFYAAARFSEIMAGEGFPIVGYGDFDEYYFEDLSTQLWRLSLGLGYRFSDSLVIKTEYSLEQGLETSGEERDHEDFLGTEAAFKF
jgi:cell division protein FtsB